MSSKKTSKAPTKRVCVGDLVKYVGNHYARGLCHIGLVVDIDDGLAAAPVILGKCVATGKEWRFSPMYIVSWVNSEAEAVLGSRFFNDELVVVQSSRDTVSQRCNTNES